MLPRIRSHSSARQAWAETREVYSRSQANLNIVSVLKNINISNNWSLFIGLRPIVPPTEGLLKRVETRRVPAL